MCIKIKAIAVVVVSLIIVAFLIPTDSKKHDEIDKLAFAYLFYQSSVCPNTERLNKLKDDYKINSNTNKRLWIDNNFNDQFMKRCNEYEK